MLRMNPWKHGAETDRWITKYNYYRKAEFILYFTPSIAYVVLSSSTIRCQGHNFQHLQLIACI